MCDACLEWSTTHNSANMHLWTVFTLPHFYEELRVCDGGWQRSWPVLRGCSGLGLGLNREWDSWGGGEGGAGKLSHFYTSQLSKATMLHVSWISLHIYVSVCCLVLTFRSSWCRRIGVNCLSSASPSAHKSWTSPPFSLPFSTIFKPDS